MIAKKTLKASVKAFKDFAKKNLPDEKLQELDARDECPIGHCAAHVQPGQAGHSAPVHSRRVRRFRWRRLRRVLRVRRDGANRFGRRHGGAGHVPGQRSDHGRRHAGAKKTLAGPNRGRRICCLPMAPPNRTPAAIWARWKAPRTGSCRMARSPVTRSMAASNGSRTVGLPMPTRFWRTRPAVPVGSSSKRARRVSSTTSRKISTASVSATPQPSRSPTCTSMPTGLLAGWKGRDYSRRRPYSVTRG